MEKMIRLWTIQTPLAWSSLQEKQILYGDGRRADRFYRMAYAWLREQMALRTEGYTGRNLVWFWAKKPDFRQYRYRNYCKAGEPMVLLECLVPASRVLLSDYDTWHSVLNSSYLALSEAEWDEWHDRLDSGKIPAGQAEQEKRKTWERIFDFVALGRNPEWMGPPPIEMQATVETLRLNEVQSSRVFISRRARR